MPRTLNLGDNCIGTLTEEGKLIIELDINAEATEVSSSGKNYLVANTGGFAKITGTALKVNVCLIKPV